MPTAKQIANDGLVLNKNKQSVDTKVQGGVFQVLNIDMSAQVFVCFFYAPIVYTCCGCFCLYGLPLPAFIAEKNYGRFYALKVHLGCEACHSKKLLINSDTPGGILHVAKSSMHGCFHFAYPSEICLPRVASKPRSCMALHLTFGQAGHCQASLSVSI